MSKQTKIVKYKQLDIANSPKLTSVQESELAALAAMPDSEIDFSDIPELTEEAWKNVVIGKFCQPFGLAKAEFRVTKAFFEPLPDDFLNAFEGKVESR